jgi:alkanesulfonate monooxygenase SsuD/methylene tetrahydromethanopterin reductase-like flavin-dependent oxidoreductase (luciferase family)
MPTMPALSFAAMPGRRRASLELAAELERRGFSGLYLASFGGDTIAVSAAIALATKTIEIGTSIVNVYLRHPSEYAKGACLVHELSGGRFRFGVGVSHAPMNAHFGVKTGKPTEDMRRFVEGVREGAKGQGDLPPIVLATLRRPMVRLAGEIADGAVWANAARSTIGRFLEPLSAEQRQGKGFFVGNMIPTCISDDRAAAAAVLRKTLRMYVQLPNYQTYWSEAGYENEMAEIRAALVAGRKDDLPHLMTDRWLEDVTLFGSAAEVREGVEKWVASGVKTPILVPSSTSGGQIKAIEEIMAAFAS